MVRYDIFGSLCITQYPGQTDIHFVRIFPVDFVFSVDLAHPELYDDIFPVKFPNDVHKDGMLVNGVGLRIETPYKDDVFSAYKATFHPSMNAVRITKPSMPYLLRNCKEATKKMAQAVAKKHTDYHYPTTYPDSLASSAFAVENDESRQTITALLQFSGPRLTNKIYSRGADQEGEEIHLFAAKVAVTGDPKTKLDPKEGQIKWVLEWFLAELDDYEEKRLWQQDDNKLVSDKEVAMAHAEATFAGLGLDDISPEELQRCAERQRELEELQRKEQVFRDEMAKLKRDQELAQEAKRAADEAKLAAQGLARSELQRQQELVKDAQWSARKDAEAELARYVAMMESAAAKREAQREAQREAEVRSFMEGQERRHREETERLQALLLQSHEELAEAERKRVEAKSITEIDMGDDGQSGAEEEAEKRSAKKPVAKRGAGPTGSKYRTSNRRRAHPLKAPPSEASATKPPPAESQAAEGSYTPSFLNSTPAAAESAKTATAPSFFEAVKTSSPMRPGQSVDATSPASTTSSLYFGAGASGRLSPWTRSMSRTMRNVHQSEYNLVLEGLDTWEARPPSGRSAFARAASIDSIDLDDGDAEEVDVESTYGKENDSVDDDL